jgi:hypothetical protein
MLDFTQADIPRFQVKMVRDIRAYIGVSAIVGLKQMFAG